MSHRTDMLLTLGAPFEARYGHFIGGDFVVPADGTYRPVFSPVNGALISEVADLSARDRERAMFSAGKALGDWRSTPAAKRADILRQFADRLDNDLEILAMAESWDSGKPVRDLMTDELPLAINRLRDCAAAAEVLPPDTSVAAPRSVTGSSAFPLLGALWQAAPALAAGYTLIIETSPETPISAMILAESIAAILPDGVVNIIAGRYATAATLQSAPVTSIYLADLATDETLLDQAVESLATFAFNRGDVSVGPVQALIAGEIFETVIERLLARLAMLTPDNPLNPSTRIGAQTSAGTVDELLAHHTARLSAGGEHVTGGNDVPVLSAALAGGYYVEPTVLRCDAATRTVPAPASSPHLTVAAIADIDEAMTAVTAPGDKATLGLWTGAPKADALTSRYAQHADFWTNCLPASPSHLAVGLCKRAGRYAGTGHPDTEFGALPRSSLTTGP